MRREKEIAETKCELSQQESVRFQQRCEYFEKQLEEARASLSEEKMQSEVEVERMMLARATKTKPLLILFWDDLTM